MAFSLNATGSVLRPTANALSSGPPFSVPKRIRKQKYKRSLIKWLFHLKHATGFPVRMPYSSICFVSTVSHHISNLDWAGFRGHAIYTTKGPLSNLVFFECHLNPPILQGWGEVKLPSRPLLFVAISKWREAFLNAFVAFSPQIYLVIARKFPQTVLERIPFYRWMPKIAR